MGKHRRMWVKAWYRGRWAAGVAVFCAGALIAPTVALASSGPTLITHADPYAACTIGGPGFNYPSAEVEPYVAVNPANRRNIIGVFQQDRWSNGGAHGLAAGVSFNGGASWSTVQLPFSTCAHGLGYERASDPWVSFGPDGTAYAVSISFDQTTPRSDVAAAVSRNGGNTWGRVRELIVDNNKDVLNDKESVTADPVHPGVAYAIWDRVDASKNNQPTYFSRTTDSGRTWSTPVPITDTANNVGSIGEVIVVDPRTDTLYDVYDAFTFNPDGSVATSVESVKRSTDQGATWSSPVAIATDMDIGAVDPVTGALLRTGSGLPDVAIDKKTGQLYVVWEDARFSGGKYDEIALSTSTDGGNTWSTPIRVNNPTGLPAVTPMVAVNNDGVVGVSYFDFRTLPTSDPATLPTSYWLATSPAGGASFTHEAPIIKTPFDLLSAPFALGYFVGDYQGLTAIGDSFLSVFAQATGTETSGSQPQNRTDIYFKRTTQADETPVSAGAPPAFAGAQPNHAPASGGAQPRPSARLGPPTRRPY
jgi:hypothetical protein